MKPGVATISEPSITLSAETSLRSAALPTWVILEPSTIIDPSRMILLSGSRVRMKRTFSILTVALGIGELLLMEGRGVSRTA